MARSQPPPALDATGTQAAFYPSEDVLWTVGPPINAPGGQGVELPPQPGPPVTAAGQAAVEAMLHEQLNGETSNLTYDEMVVNPAVYGRQGLGDWNDQPYYSGHSQNTVSNPSSEQGWGVGPARRWAHYPKVESPNPARNEGQHLRNGELNWVVSDSSLYERSQLAWQQQWDPYKYRRPVPTNVPVPQAVPFAQTVPAFAGGQTPIPGLDIPVSGSGDEQGVYWMYPTQ